MIKPLTNHILIRPIEAETKSGIIIPDMADKEKPKIGRVIAIGSDEMPVKVGDEVLFRKYGPDEFEFEDEEYLIATEEDLLAKIE